jgi:DHA1 family bicyclomycin/chloramphenicol resistance-like MFS transporter
MTAASSKPAPRASTPWGLVVLLSALGAIGPLSIDTYLPSLPTIAHDIRAPAGAVEVTVAVYFAGLALGQLLFGPASDRLGRRMPMLAGLALYVVASLACALAPNVQVLIAARLVQSIGGCASMVISRAVVRDHFDHQESARFLSLMTLVSGLAPILAPLIGSAILTVAGWRTIFVALAAFGAATAAAIVLRLPESRTAEVADQASREHPFQAYSRLLSEPRLLGYLLGGAFNSACIFTYIASSPAVLIGVYGVSPTAFSLLFGMNSIGLVAGAQLNRLLLRRHPADRVLAVSAWASVGLGLWLAAAAITGAGGLVGLLAPLFLTISASGLIQINTTAGGLAVDPTRSGSTSALFGASAFGLGAATASIAGALADATPRPMALVICACLGLCALSLSGLAFRRG